MDIGEAFMIELDDILKRSLYREATFEARRYQEKHPEKSERASREWNIQYWWPWARSRWLEHIRGQIFWIELGEDDFDLTNRGIFGNQELLDSILRQVERGRENLDIINWATRSKKDMDEVLEILEKLDLNRHRDELKHVTS
jgi:hypothetical protein